MKTEILRKFIKDDRQSVNYKMAAWSLLQAQENKKAATDCLAKHMPEDEAAEYVERVLEDVAEVEVN